MLSGDNLISSAKDGLDLKNKYLELFKVHIY